VKNAHVMAEAFVQKGYNIFSGGTDNHLMLLDLRPKGFTGKFAEETLGKVDITVNKNMIPFDTESPLVTSGIRIGTPAITTRGFKESDCLKVVDWIDHVLENASDEQQLKNTKTEINEFMKNFPLY